MNTDFERKVAGLNFWILESRLAKLRVQALTDRWSSHYHGLTGPVHGSQDHGPTGRAGLTGPWLSRLAGLTGPWAHRTGEGSRDLRGLTGPMAQWTEGSQDHRLTGRRAHRIVGLQNV